MEFEHYIQQGQQKLRCGYTTGTCAALAGKAAVRMLLGGQKTEEISVLTPKGLWVTTAVEEIQSGDGEKRFSGRDQRQRPGKQRYCSGCDRVPFLPGFPASLHGRNGGNRAG